MYEIIIEVLNKTKGWIKFDLAGYDINIQQDVAITIEWVEGSKNGNILSLPLLIPSFNSIHYFKSNTNRKWYKYNVVSTAMVLKYEQ